MKTCSFRNAKPRSSDEGLFCHEEPDARYALLPCNNCPLCMPPYDVARRQQPAVRFGPSQRHRFVNGYQTILNCPADCHTRNIVYVMTCPCGEYEYISETSQRIGDRLKCKLKLESLEDLFVMSADHRQHGNRIIHEFLIGTRNVDMTRTHEKDYESVNTASLVRGVSSILIGLERWSKIECWCTSTPLDVPGLSKSFSISTRSTNVSFR